MIKQKQLGNIIELDKDGYGTINFNNSRISNVGNPLNNNDLCNKNYVNITIQENSISTGDADTVLLSDGNTNFWSKITDAYISTNANINIHKLSTGSDGYVLEIYNGSPEWRLKNIGISIHDELLGLDQDDHQQYLLVNGTRALSGNLDADGYKIIDLGNPSDLGDISNKYYIDTKLPSSGGVMNGDISMSGRNIKNITHSNNQDLLNKQYIISLNNIILQNYIYLSLFGDGLKDNGDMNDLILNSNESYTMTGYENFNMIKISGSNAKLISNGIIKCKILDLSDAYEGSIIRLGNDGQNGGVGVAGIGGEAIEDGYVGGSGAGSFGIAGTIGVGAAGGGVLSPSPACGGSGGVGGSGGDGVNSGGGSGSVPAITNIHYAHDIPLIPTKGSLLVKGGGGGRGGGSGGGDGVSAIGGSSGGGGSGAPYLLICCETLITSSNTAQNVILCNGGNGGNGSDGDDSGGLTGGGSGGGGGGGGRIDLRFLKRHGPSAINLVNANGGNGGNSGLGKNSGSDGIGGAGGNGGCCSYTDLSTGITTWAFGSSGSLGSGTMGGIGGICELTIPGSTISSYIIMAPEYDSLSTRQRVKDFTNSVNDVLDYLSLKTTQTWELSKSVNLNATEGIIVFTRNNPYVNLLPTAVQTLVSQMDEEIGNQSFVFYQQIGTPLYIIGNDLTSCQHGLYELCDRLGIKWYLPGDDWTIIPNNTDYKLIVNEVVNPRWRLTTSWGNWGNIETYPLDNAGDPELNQEAWMRRNKYCNGISYGAHAWNSYLDRIADAPGNPRYTQPLIMAEYQNSPPLRANPSNNGYKLHTTYYKSTDGGYTDDPFDYTSFDGGVRLFVLDRLSQLQTYYNADPTSVNAFGITTMPSDGGTFGTMSSYCICNKCVNLLRYGPWLHINQDSTISDRVFTFTWEVAKRLLNPNPTEYTQASSVLAPGMTVPNPTDLQGRYAMCAAYHLYAAPPNIVVELPHNLVIQVFCWGAAAGRYVGLSDFEMVDAWSYHRSQTNPYILLDHQFVLDAGIGEVFEPKYSSYLDFSRRKYTTDAGFSGVIETSPNAIFASGIFSWLNSRLSWHNNSNASDLLDDMFLDLFEDAALEVRKLFENFWQYTVSYVVQTNNDNSDWQLTKREIGLAYQYLANARALVPGNTVVLERLKQLRWYVHYLRLIYDYREKAWNEPNSQNHIDALSAAIRWAFCCHPKMICDAYNFRRWRITRETATVSSAISTIWDTTKSKTESPWNLCTEAQAEIRANELEADELTYIGYIGQNTQYTKTLIQPVSPNSDINYISHPAFNFVTPARAAFIAPGTESVDVNIEILTANIEEDWDVKVVLRDINGDEVYRTSLSYPHPLQNTDLNQWFLHNISFGTLTAGNYYLEVLPMGAAQQYKIAFKKKIPNALAGRCRHASPSPRQYFWVPAGTTEFSVVGVQFQSTSLVVKRGNTVISPVWTTYNEYHFVVNSGEDAQVWSVENSKWRGTIAYMTGEYLQLQQIPSLFSASPEQVLTHQIV
jgi:hypothetical protein